MQRELLLCRQKKRDLRHWTLGTQQKRVCSSQWCKKLVLCVNTRKLSINTVLKSEHSYV